MLVNNPHSIESAWTLPVSGLAAPAAPAAGPRPQLVRISDLRALLDGAPLGRFDMRPDTEAVFDALCDRERGRPEKVLMKEWTPRPAGGQLHIDGWRWTRGVRSFISSAPICHWFSEREVEATDGQVYVLEGRLSVALAEKYALPVLARLTFATGFPSQWQLLAKELHLLTVGQEAVRRQPDLVPQHTDSPGRTAGKPPQQPDSDSGSGSVLPQPQSAPGIKTAQPQPKAGSKAARSQPEPSSKAAPAKRQTRKRAAPGSSQPVPTAAGGAAQPEPPGTPPLPEEPSAAPANARGRATSRGRWRAQPAPSSPPESRSSSPAASERSSLDDTMAPLTRAMSETMYDRLKKDTRRRSPRVFLHRLTEEPRQAPPARAAAGRRGRTPAAGTAAAEHGPTARAAAGRRGRTTAAAAKTAAAAEDGPSAGKRARRAAAAVSEDDSAAPPSARTQRRRLRLASSPPASPVKPAEWDSDLASITPIPSAYQKPTARRRRQPAEDAPAIRKHPARKPAGRAARKQPPPPPEPILEEERVMQSDSSDSEVPTMKVTAARAAPAKRGTRGKKIQPTDETAERHSQPTETHPEIAASKNPSAKRPAGRARKQAPSSEPPADDTDTEGPTKKVPAARAAPAKRGARAKKTQPTEELSDEENVPPEEQSQKRGAAPAKKTAPRKGAASKKAPPKKDDMPTLNAYDEFRPSARPGTQRYRLEQMAFLTAQNDAAQPDDLFGGGLLDSGGGGGGGGLLGLADGELMAAVTPLAPGRGGGRRPAAHSSLTPVAALAAGGAYSVKTPTMATSTISPGNPLNSIHRDEAARYMVNRKKQAGPARQRLRMGTDRPAVPSFCGSSDIGSAARLIEEDAAWLLREDDPSDEPADEYFDYDG